MTRALITGGAGFIGLHLGRALAARGWAVDLFDNFARGQRDSVLRETAAVPGIGLIQGDLCKPEQVALLGSGYDVIFHLAAVIGVETVRRRPYDVLTLNARMTEAAVEIARRQKHPPRLFFASTSEVYAGTLAAFDLPVPTPETVPLTLTDPAEPRTSYMLSKLYGEEMVRFSGIPFTIVRFHNVYGPRMGMAHVIPQLLEKAYNAKALGVGGALTVASPGHSRAFCYIDDAVEYLIRLAEKPQAAGGVFNIGTETPEVRMIDLARLIADVVEFPGAILPGEDTPGSPHRRAPAMTQAADLTGFRSTVSLTDGVRRTYDWYRPQMFEAVA